MNRLQVSVRVASVGVLLAGVAGGVYLGQDQDAQQQDTQLNLAAQADTAERDLLIERQAQHAAARASQRKAEADAAAKASREAKAAASKARKLEKAALKKKATAAAAKGKSSSGASKPYTGPIPSSCNEYSGNRKIGCAILLDKGFKISEMPCLEKLFDKESGWNTKASNASSGAYGIPQALPGSKMASEGSDWKTSAATQIKWGIGYIKGRYKTPCGAWAHSESVGWY